MLVIMAGLPGTGKTAISTELARLLDGARIDKDVVRAALFPPSDIEYSDEQDDLCIDAMLGAAAFLFQKKPDHFVFLDGRTFTRRYQRDHVVSFADRHGWPWVMIECVCSDETARRRLREPHVAANRDFALYQRLKKNWEPIEHPRTVIDTDDPLPECIQRALAALQPEPIRIPVTDVFDLHSVPPRDVKGVVEEYLQEAHRMGLKALRIIHGRGIGVQREIVRSVLARTDFVAGFRDAPAEAGGWGATVVTLR